MIPKIFSLLLFCCALEQSNQGNPPRALKFTPEQVKATFDNVMSDDYIKELAKTFAVKAATHFMNEIKSKKEAMVSKFTNNEYSNPPKRKRKDDMEEIMNTGKEAVNEEVGDATKSELDENEALRLIDTPNPDGDHQESSGEFSDENKNKIPVIQVTKINGIYYRRLLGMI